ncbi:hypothetical protein C8F01DRAFT_1374619 [Mycena amicta]|nr:hypothetical protein C8F01DRAFT_1374619 [Mycena amicta]
MTYNLLSSDRPPGRRRYRPTLFWGVAGIGIVTLVLIALERNRSALFSGKKAIDVEISQPVSLPPPPARRRAYIRAATLGTEGFGSILQHFKHSIVLASALDSTLILSWNEVTDDVNVYSTSTIYNARIPQDEMTGVDVMKACRMQDYLPHGEREPLVRSLCKGEDWAAGKMGDIRRRMADCTSILDLETDELIQDMNGCIMPWVRERMTPYIDALPPALTTGSAPTRPINVGIHIRWGDTAVLDKAFDPATHNFYGSMSLPHISRVLSDLRARYSQHGIHITIAMERADSRVIDWLGEEAGSYTLLDTTDVFLDLQKLSANDVLLLGESSYGVLAHLIAPGTGVSFVEGGGFGKFSNTSGWGRHVVYMEKYTSESVRLLETPV